ncbi:DUF2061 domain-containing protein [Luteibacter flocculans]|uniref:DUF2061 domain-containing protein n=1 Tax=Luteibacter flocculans TaxID=2780091 RepID=A0ABY4T3Y3_9GAMM|nr:DUF2061 domain-containing protein [Luteibacter flocculans]URL58984.1 DUF2061 domain-containing protein [Luteibacter flocculans]
MARKIKYAATHFSIAFSMSYAVNQNLAVSTLVGIAEPIAFALGRDLVKHTRHDLPIARAA